MRIVLFIAFFTGFSAFSATPTAPVKNQPLRHNKVLQTSIDQGLRHASVRPKRKKQRKAKFLQELRKLYEPAKVPL